MSVEDSTSTATQKPITIPDLSTDLIDGVRDLSVAQDESHVQGNLREGSHVEVKNDNGHSGEGMSTEQVTIDHATDNAKNFAVSEGKAPPAAIISGADASHSEAPHIYDNIEVLGGLTHLQSSLSEPEYHDPTPRTPRPQSPIRSIQRQEADQSTKATEGVEDGRGKGKSHDGDEMVDDDSRSEIQSIMEQFEGQDDQEDPQHTSEGSAQPSPAHPPRQSSLSSPVKVAHSSPTIGLPQARAELQSPTKPPSLRSVSFTQQAHSSPTDAGTHSSPLASPLSDKALPPIPEPESELPFDFHRFLEQLKHRSADPVAKFLRSFLTEFGKKQWMVHEQVKIISDFLTFITSKMAQCDVWREVSDFEFDNAQEGMEKLVMNRLYSQTFSPAIPPPAPASPRKGKTKTPRLPGPGRRGQHQEDIERDEILAQKVRIYGWVRERHLDIKPVGKSGQRFLTLAQQELLKIKSYRAPRDKIICVLNCCKVIFGLLKNSKEADTSADSFVPLLIYVILQANPDHLVSNVQYIFRFRNQNKLGGEAGYYLSSLMGAIQFIENLDRTSLTVDDEEFEKSVEAAVSAIAEKLAPVSPVELAADSEQHLSEKQRDPEKVQRTPRASMDQRASEHQRGPSNSGVQAIEAPVAGLLKTIQKPLNSIGRMFSEELGAEPSSSGAGSPRPSQRATPTPEQTGRLSPAVFQTPRKSTDGAAGDNKPAQGTKDLQLRAEDAAARQASAEAAEAQRIQRAEHKDVVDTLAGMFPTLDRDIIDDVVRMKEGRVGSAVDACLALNN